MMKLVVSAAIIALLVAGGIVWLVARDSEAPAQERGTPLPNPPVVFNDVVDTNGVAPESDVPQDVAPVDVAAQPIVEAPQDTQAPAPPAPAVDIAIPDLVLETYDGTSVALRDLIGRPLILNAWAAWCPFCVKELPDFATAQAELGDDVLIVAINRAESLTVARSFSDERGASSLMLLLDPSDSFYTSIGGFSMPETLFINSDGSLHLHKRGVMMLDEILQQARELR